MSLTDAERELLWVDALECGPWHYFAEGVSCSCGRPMDGNETCSLMRDVAAAVEQIAQARATAAVEAFRARAVEAIEAVDPVTWALAGQHAGDDAARIIRDLT